MNTKKIVAFGEIVWDVFKDGSRLGGAPLNFTYYCLKNACEAKIISAIGRDELGAETLSQMEKFSIPADFVQISDTYQSGKVMVSVDEKGLASYEICSPSAWDYIANSPDTHKFLSQADAFVFGSLAQRNAYSRRSLFEFIGLLPPSCLKVFDVNLRQNFYTEEILEKSMKVSNIVKLNDEEVVKISEMFGVVGSESERAQRIFKLFNLDYLILTLGPRGHLIVSDGEVLQSPAVDAVVVDTVGAGDSFTATFISCLLNSKSLREASDEAAKMAAKVCSYKGALIP